MESSYMGAASGPQAPNQDLVRIADELLEQTRALRRQHDELRDALAGIRVVTRDETPQGGDHAGDADDHAGGGTPDTMHPMVLQMALVGETREAAKEQLHALGADNVDAVVDEVFDRTEAQRAAQQRRRLFSRG
jgi:hypothetical protein